MIVKLFPDFLIKHPGWKHPLMGLLNLIFNWRFAKKIRRLEQAVRANIEGACIIVI